MPKNNKSKVKLNKLQTPEFAYFLGLFWADGSIGKKYCNINIQLQENDAKTLQPLIQSLGKFPCKDSIRIRDNGKTYRHCYFYMTDEPFHQFLSDLNFQEKSTLSCQKVIDFLNPELHHYFLRGYFDGDGTCVFAKNGGKHMTISSSKNYDWSPIQNLLKKLNINHVVNIVTHQHDNPNHSDSRLVISDTLSILKFGLYIYQGKQFGLHRKKIKFLEIAKFCYNKLQSQDSIGFDKKKQMYRPAFRYQKKHYSFKYFKNYEDAKIAIDNKHKEINSLKYQQQQISNEVIQLLS